MIILNETHKIPECTSEDKRHDFVITKQPPNNRSGWHEEKCSICGLEIGYDDSD